MQKTRGNYCIIFLFLEDIDKIVEMKNSVGKIVPHSNLQVGTTKTISSKVKNKRTATGNV
jgi:hypothetical protein